MSILIADSGSTKTRWALSCPYPVVVTTAGLNPRLTPESDFHDAVRQMMDSFPQSSQIQEVWFYGAGCGTTEMQSCVTSWLQRAFPAIPIHVVGDLLGACRASCGNSPGLVGILGTGSNLCHYDGTEILKQCPSTGYLLGDEGSGNHIGRLLLKDYLEGTMPDEVSRAFHQMYPLTTDQFLNHIYRENYPNRFLASLTPFAASMRHHPYVANLLLGAFDSFMALSSRHHLPQGLPLHLVGGITATFHEELFQSAHKHNLQLLRLLPDPLLPLLRFHSSTEKTLPEMK